MFVYPQILYEIFLMFINMAMVEIFVVSEKKKNVVLIP
jgi:hypothetical protein